MPGDPAPPKAVISPAKGAVIGAVVTAGGAITFAQHSSGEVAASESLTLIIVAAGLVVGAVIGAVLARRRAQLCRARRSSAWAPSSHRSARASYGARTLCDDLCVRHNVESRYRVQRYCCPTPAE